MSPVDGGFVRLDQDTGAMSLCAKKQGAEQADGWACTPMDDSQASLRDEVDKLKAENAELKEEIRRLEDTFIAGKRDGAGGRDGDQSLQGGPPGGMPPGMKLPSEEDVDRAVDYLEGMIRKFRERFEDFGEKTDPDRHPRGDRGDRSDRDWPGPRDRPSNPDDNRDKPDSRGSTPL